MEDCKLQIVTSICNLQSANLQFPVMEIKRGIAVSPGVAIGPALVLDTEGVRIPARFIDAMQSKAALERFRDALQAPAANARVQQDAFSRKLGKQYGAIFAAHALLLEDPELIREVEELILKSNHSPEYAVSRVIRKHAKALENLRSETFRMRSADLFDIEKSILQQLLGTRGEALSLLREPVIVLAHDLTPSQ